VINITYTTKPTSTGVVNNGKKFKLQLHSSLLISLANMFTHNVCTTVQ